MKTSLKELPRDALREFMEHLGQKQYRADQVISWMYGKLATSFNEMTDLSEDLRKRLKEVAFINSLDLLQKQISSDGTYKFLFELKDGESIESVLIPNTRGEQQFTLCISSQVGCAAACKFCVTGTLGLKRNLKAREIIDQVVAVKRYLSSESAFAEPSLTNIVLMGMGEPMNNYREVIHALTILTDLMGISRRKITLSTSGIIPGIKKLAKEGHRFNLAVSLNATTDEVRNRIMPVNRKYPIKELLEACRQFPLPPNRRITFEYVLLGGLNDSREDAHRLPKLLKGIPSKINLIPYNSSGARPELNQPSEPRISEFQTLLRQAGMTVIIRKSMGADISAACGQLKAAYR